jgi:hypothetical protein
MALQGTELVGLRRSPPLVNGKHQCNRIRSPHYTPTAPPVLNEFGSRSTSLATSGFCAWAPGPAGPCVICAAKDEGVMRTQSTSLSARHVLDYHNKKLNPHLLTMVDDSTFTVKFFDKAKHVHGQRRQARDVDSPFVVDARQPARRHLQGACGCARGLLRRSPCRSPWPCSR